MSDDVWTYEEGDPRISRERVPVFLMLGEEVVDVGFVDVATDGERWGWDAGARFDIGRTGARGADRFVVETPVGCFASPLRVSPWSTVILVPSAGGELTPTRCVRPGSVAREPGTIEETV